MMLQTTHIPRPRFAAPAVAIAGPSSRFLIAITLATVLGCASAFAEDQPHGKHAATSHRSFADAEKWATVFDDPARDAWQKPSALVDALGLRTGMTVAEIGAGTGYLLRYLAAAVGAEGAVFLADIEPSLVAHIRARAEREKAANVIPVLASKDHPRLPAKSVDVILFLDTYHHIDERLVYLRNLHRFLKPGGKVAIVDWRKEPLPVGPPVDHKIAQRHVVEEMEEAGFKLTGMPLQLPYQYFLLFEVRD